MTASLSIKQGATLQLTIAASNADATPVDQSTVTASCSVRDLYMGLIGQLSLVASGTPGQWTVRQETGSWPVGTLSADLKLVVTATGVVIKSATFQIIVLVAITT